IPRCAGRYILELTQPGSATQFPATHANASKSSCFLTEADLTHFNADLELAREYFDQLAEINAVISGIKESSFGVVGLILDVRQLHFQLQTSDYLTGPVQRGQLPFPDFLKFLKVLLMRNPVYLFYLAVVGDLLLLHLKPDQF